jgi:hypothetical protein
MRHAAVAHGVRTVAERAASHARRQAICTSNLKVALAALLGAAVGASAALVAV